MLKSSLWKASGLVLVNGFFQQLCILYSKFPIRCSN